MAYLIAQDSVRVIALKADLNFKVGIRQQDAATLGAVYELVSYSHECNIVT